MYNFYFKSTIRKNPSSEELDSYYRLVESYRNFDNRICHRTLLNVGFMEDASAEQLNAIRKELNNLHQKQPTIFEQVDPVVLRYTNALRQQLITEKRSMPIG